MSDSFNARPGIPRRLASMAYEILLLAAALLILMVLPHVLIGAFTHRLATPLVLQAHFFLALLLYFGWFWTHGGQTLAMKTWRLKLHDAAGGPIRPAQALIRYLLSYPSLLLGGVGIFWAFFDRDGQFLHDRLAGTRIALLPPAPKA
ncbi:RDD family protein [Rhodocyclus tenuis]|uniref:RDD family protein n=2 Tax=Rhodocyclus TaxID=1064 RepID=A0A6L5JYN0_RHOTE|nr:RDD family protein [Rhodocyclus gracilis]MQY51690.1 RDD family protein [Rhodocyclus gracilis]NJA89049.1 RDD family protein [Rhodocyclus gracilis]